MHSSPAILAFAAFVAPALADTHFMYAGFFAGSNIVGLEYDDVTEALTLVNTTATSATSGQKWISLDVRTKQLHFQT